MDFYIDCANTNLIKHYISNFNLKGITCNPTIIIKDHSSIREVIDTVPEDKELYFEVIATDHEGMIREAIQLAALRKNITVKIPATPEGFIAIRSLNQSGIRTLATAVYSVQQALSAAYSGAKEVAPYISRIDNAGFDGVQTALDIHKAFVAQNVSCIVFGASFKSVSQVNEVLIGGIRKVTLSTDLFEKYITDANGIKAAEDFKAAWKEAHGTEQLII
ncbi:MAG: transaldolase family protein [Eubacteriales bacterium]|nr:transaldolase family protein [Eubacteriales bacterium]